ncbi:UNKNOWN [Stylonychia lemnae]|uniref:Uncharacterized protein n=1 Tax=Stylonychia lemnae TaxID=5949 RepID=A0A078A3B8_STYLE|nr:UNKNOWN [Stylonychia lemnae]|eukprot:CDW76312.1 UNKNOWN [Stylonychia lemnae]
MQQQSIKHIQNRYLKTREKETESLTDELPKEVCIELEDDGLFESDDDDYDTRNTQPTNRSNTLLINFLGQNRKLTNEKQLKFGSCKGFSSERKNVILKKVSQDQLKYLKQVILSKQSDYSHTKNNYAESSFQGSSVNLLNHNKKSLGFSGQYEYSKSQENTMSFRPKTASEQNEFIFGEVRQPLFSKNHFLKENQNKLNQNQQQYSSLRPISAYIGIQSQMSNINSSDYDYQIPMRSFDNSKPEEGQSDTVSKRQIMKYNSLLEKQNRIEQFDRDQDILANGQVIVKTQSLTQRETPNLAVLKSNAPLSSIIISQQNIQTRRAIKDINLSQNSTHKIQSLISATDNTKLKKQEIIQLSQKEYNEYMKSRQPINTTGNISDQQNNSNNVGQNMLTGIPIFQKDERETKIIPINKHKKQVSHDNYFSLNSTSTTSFILRPDLLGHRTKRENEFIVKSYFTKREFGANREQRTGSYGASYTNIGDQVDSLGKSQKFKMILKKGESSKNQSQDQGKKKRIIWDLYTTVHTYDNF